jgi:hypothetical protein
VHRQRPVRRLSARAVMAEEVGVTEGLDAVPTERFAALWNTAATLDEVAAVRRVAGRNVPRWAVLARAVAGRRRGVELERFGGSGADGR